MKIFFLFISLIFITQCGYNPIYNQDDKNFVIKKIELNKNKNNKMIENRLKNYKNESNASFFYDLNLETSEQKIVISKDKKGKALLLRMIINLNLKVFEKEKLIMQKKYVNSFDYQNMNKKFELSNYENEIKIDIYNEIISKILIDLTNLK